MADEDYGEMAKVIQRRQLIRNQLKNTVNEFAKEQPELEVVGTQKFTRSLRQLNKVAENADHTRELQLDALGLKHLSSAAKAQALHLNDLSRGYDLDKLSEGLKAFQYDGKEEIDWTALGNATLTLACWLPTVDTMLGAIEKTAKERKAPVRRRTAADEADDSAEAQLASKPTEVTSEDQQPATDDSAALKRSALQLELLKELTNGSDKAAIDLIDFLVDHEDVVQTVENFFDFSFLLKDKKVAEGLADDGLPKVVIADPNALDATGKKQMVLTINMGDLEHLVAEVRKHRGAAARQHPLHRTSDLYQCSTLPEQIECLEEQAKKRQRRS